MTDTARVVAVLCPRPSGRWSRRTAAVVTVLGAALVLLPLGWMVLTSLRPESKVQEPGLLPAAPRFANYAEATTQIPFWHYLANSLLITVPVVIGTARPPTVGPAAGSSAGTNTHTERKRWP